MSFTSIRVNATSVSIPVVLRSTTDNTGVTGKVFGDITAQYWRQGGTPQAITEVTLAAVDSNYSSGGFREVDATNMPGLYRFDVPNAAFAHGADWVVVSLKCTGAYTVLTGFQLVYDGQVRSFTPQALASGTLTLDANADADNGAYLGKAFVVVYSDDATDLGAVFTCHTSYTGATKVALGTWTRVPTGTVGTMVLVASADVAGIAALEATSQSILTDTAEIGAAGAGLTALASATNLATVDTVVDSILADTGTDGVVVASINNNAITNAAMNADAFTKAFTTALTEAYSTDGSTLTVAQALYELVQRGEEIAISGTTMTIKKRDGTTTAKTLTLGDATNPTTVTRAS